MSPSNPQLRQPLPLDETLAACPVCGNASWKIAFPPDVVWCRRCHSLFRQPRPTQAAIAQSYDTGHTYSQWQTKGESWNSLWQRRADYVRRLRSEGDLLDIGIGDASFLKQMNAIGFRVEGTELSKAGARYAQEAELKVRVGQFTSLSFAPSSFDVVTMWHVLEHVPDPKQVLEKVYQVLRPGGLFILAVPNEVHPVLRHRLFPSRFPRAFDPLVWGGEVHLTHFTPRTIKSFLQRQGFTILRFEVDDFYPDRTPVHRLKFWVQQTFARTLGWHSAVAMQLLCLKPSAG